MTSFNKRNVKSTHDSCIKKAINISDMTILQHVWGSMVVIFIILMMVSLLSTAVNNKVYNRQPIVQRPSTNLLTAVGFM